MNNFGESEIENAALMCLVKMKSIIREVPPERMSPVTRRFTLEL
jgi:hypothetical protein